MVPKAERPPFTAAWYGPNKTLIDQNMHALSDAKKKIIQEVLDDPTTRDDVNQMFKNQVDFGGHWMPTDCQARSRVAILVPYRANETHRDTGRELEVTKFLKHAQVLNTFEFKFYLNHLRTSLTFQMIPWLQFQQVEFKIYLIHQGWADFNFNRARLLTVGYLEAEKDGPWDCYTTHDIDRLPLNYNISYHCPAHGKTYHYTSFGGDFGGCGSLPGPTIRAINGFSNMFFGWGGEDQDIG